MNADRCPYCGASLAIVGRLHLCRMDKRLGDVRLICVV
jgi:hypothetical protein